jgi:peptidoglycan/LPS O-acetylase OafA/YrhL
VATREPISTQPRDVRGAAPVRVGFSVRPRLRRYVLSVSVLFTVLTVVSSTIALASGQETDTHLHLLMRLLFVMLGMGAFEAVVALRERFPGAPLAMLTLAGSTVLLLSIVVSVWVSGHAGVDLHPNAYRDAVLNVGAVGVVLVALAGIVDLSRRRR